MKTPSRVQQIDSNKKEVGTMMEYTTRRNISRNSIGKSVLRFW